MRSFANFAIVFAISAGLAGCGGSASDTERLETLVPDAQATIPVSGQVLVDGKPIKDLWVKLHLIGETKGTLQPKAQTDAEGKFQITSYVSGDGAPVGDYKITLEWLTLKPIGNAWVGPNKLAGPCGSAKTTEFSVSVADEPVVLPTFEVKAKPNADSLKPSNNSLNKKSGN